MASDDDHTSLPADAEQETPPTPSTPDATIEPEGPKTAEAADGTADTETNAPGAETPEHDATSQADLFARPVEPFSLPVVPPKLDYPTVPDSPAVSDATAEAPSSTDPAALPSSPLTPLIAKHGVEVVDVTRRFGRRRIIDGASFTAAPGRITALIGPNGSGKTTILRMIATLLPPTSGSIRVNGLDPTANVRQVRAAIGWMPDTCGVWPTLTVTQALRTTGRLYGLSRREARDRTDHLIDLLDMRDVAKRRAGRLSRGQQQRLSLARALVNDPDVLLLDEPASGLDPSARIALRNHLRQFADVGKTVIISSHVLAELDEVADDAIFLRDGDTVATDSVRAAAATARPWTLRVLDATGLSTALGELGVGFRGAGQDSLEVEISIESDEQASAIVTALVRLGIPIVSFHPSIGQLEHTFLDLEKKAGDAQ